LRPILFAADAVRRVATSNQFAHGLLARLVGEGNRFEHLATLVRDFELQAKEGTNDFGRDVGQLFGEAQVLGELICGERDRKGLQIEQLATKIGPFVSAFVLRASSLPRRLPGESALEGGLVVQIGGPSARNDSLPQALRGHAKGSP